MGEALTKAGRYQIVSELGRGSMGVVYQGFDPVIGRTVAIKTMLVEGLPPSEFEEYKARFQREAQSAGILTHPNIVTVYDFGEDNGVLFLAMEFLEGKSIQQLVENRNVMPIETIVPMYEQICSALDHAHQHSIVHRDIKPANIMILESGLVKVTDFGIAKIMSMGMTQAGQILGTPNYMSPEQVKGRKIDGRSDIFSLGVILYELVTGEKPFGGQNITTVIYKIINENPIPPRELDSAIHPGLSFVIFRALAKNPDERYQTCRELSDDLRNYKNLGGAASPSATVVIKVPPIQPQPVEPPPPPPMAPPRAAPVQVEPHYAPSPAEPIYVPPVEPSYAPPVSKPRSAAIVQEVRPSPAPREPRRVQPPAVQPARTPARPAPVIAAAKPQRRNSSTLPWILLAIILTALLGGGGYYFLQQQNKQASPPLSEPQTTTTVTPPDTQKPNPPATNQPSATITQPASAEPAPQAKAPVERTETPTPVPAVSRQGKLVIESNVKGAQITLDGQSTRWATPHTFANISLGEHEVSLSKDGYAPASRQVTVEAGRTSSARMELAENAPPPPAPPVAQPVAEGDATLVIDTKPPGLELLIDGKPLGTSPAKAVVTPGAHTYTIKCPSGEVTKNFTIGAGKLRSTTITCTE